MTGLIIAALGAAAIYLAYLFLSGDIRRLVRALRWIVGGGLLAGAGLLGLRGQMMIAGLLGAAGAAVLTRGRLGPLDFGAGMTRPNNGSQVSAHYFDMRLDHDTGQVSGAVRVGDFAGMDLDALSAEQCWTLYNEAASDPDSIALFEAWLDANRDGWRDHFATQFGMDEEEQTASGAQSGGLSGADEAYAVLGLEPGASAADIRAAHRQLLKRVHPDVGGSPFLAAKINQAKDFLLKRAG